MVQFAGMRLGDEPWTLRAIIERAGQVLRQEGVKSLWFRVLGELGYRRTILFQLDLTHDRQDKAVPAGVRFGLLSPNRVQDLLGLVRYCDEREIRRRLAAGQLCVVGYADGKPAYVNWLALGQVWIDFFGIQAVLSPGTAYSYELYVDPACRGLGLNRAGVDFGVQRLRERGFTKCVGVVVPENRAGLGYTLACGCQPIGWVRSLRLGGFRRCWIGTSIEPAPLRLAR